MLAATVALFTLMFALPQKAMAENYVTIDGVKKTILSTDFLRGNGDDNAFAVYLYLSSDKKEYVLVRGNKNLHAIYEPIRLDKKEEKHEGQWYWDVIYTKEGYGKDKFWASGDPLNGYALFSSGYMTIYGDPRTSRRICGINLPNGKVTDTKHGDGQEHTITIDYKHERTKPSAGTFTMGTVTDTSIDLSWTHGSDETTPRDKLFYIVQYRKVGDTRWRVPRVGNATSYTIEGLEPETEYEVEINVYDESGNYTSYSEQTVTTKKATATKYGIDIGGVEITADNYTDISASNGFTAVKSGTVSYNPENRTLTLDNAVIEGNSNSITFTDEDMYHAYTLVLKGNGNRLTSAFSSTLLTNSNLTITGGGSAQITGNGECGIFVDTDATLTITGGCSITAEGECGITGRDGKSETLIIDGATVKAKSNGEYGSICDFKEIVLKNCAITAPSGATIEGGNVMLGGGICTDWVTIEPVTTESYSIYIGDVEITADNYTDISASNGFTAVKSGTVSYNPENRTLTLDNAVIEGNSNSITFTDEDMYHAYTLVLKGNGNRLTSAFSSTLLTNSNLTITGGGSAQITGNGECGIFVDTDATLTITGGCSITAEGECGITGRDGKSETLIIDGATVKAKSNGEYGSICDFKEIVLKNCAITAPSGATIEGGNVMLGGGICTDWVTIEPVTTESYSIYIGDVEITADNYTDISASNGFTAVKSGTVSYNPENRTLTLDNAVIEGNSNSITFTDEDMYHAYTLVLKGNGNRLTSAFSSTLLTNSNLTITGGGSAQITGNGECGIFVDTDATLTITGGCSITAEGECGITGRDGKSETLIIDGATVKAKSNGEYGSICDFKEIVLKNCAITAPSGATIEGGNVMLGGGICTDWVTIEPIGTGIDTPTADVPARKQGVYNLQGVRLGTSLDRLPKGIYVVDGKKVVKK